MKEKLKELAKTIISMVIAVLVISLLFWLLGCISIKLLNLPINFTYPMSIGLVALISMIRGIVKFIIEGIDIDTDFNTSKEQKEYKYKIVYKNKDESKGTLVAGSLKEAKKLILDNDVNIVNQGKKLFYFNSNEIQFLQVEEIEE